MSAITADQFRDICAGVWRDRAAVVAGRGFLTEESALMRAVYWRLCKSALVNNKAPENHSSAQTVLTYETVIGCVLELNATRGFDGAPFLRDLRERYQMELILDCHET